jgi:hypothetical protein
VVADRPLSPLPAPPARHDLASYVLMGAVLLLVLQPGPLPALLVGLLVYELSGTSWQRAARLAAFRRVVFAQVRIAALSAVTWLYLGVALPLLGVDPPFPKTLILVTFVCGLQPVVGNLISNTVIVIVSLGHSLAVLRSLSYLGIIHRLVPGRRHHRLASIPKAWELLVAIAGDGSRFRYSRPDCRTDLLRLCKGRTERTRLDLVAPGKALFAALLLLDQWRGARTVNSRMAGVRGCNTPFRPYR